MTSSGNLFECYTINKLISFHGCVNLSLSNILGRKRIIQIKHISIEIKLIENITYFAIKWKYSFEMKKKRCVGLSGAIKFLWIIGSKFFNFEYKQNFIPNDFRGVTLCVFLILLIWNKVNDEILFSPQDNT